MQSLVGKEIKIWKKSVNHGVQENMTNKTSIKQLIVQIQDVHAPIIMDSFLLYIKNDLHNVSYSPTQTVSVGRRSILLKPGGEAPVIGD